MGLMNAASGTLKKWKPYPKYKDSGVEWLGEIPEQWEAKKIKRLCLVKRGASPRPIDDQIYFDDDGEYSWVRISDVTSSSKYLEKTEQKLSKLGKSRSVAIEPGELFLSIAATVGKPIIANVKCCIHDGFVYFVGLKKDKEYLFYLFSSGELYKGLGKLGTQLNLNTDTIGDIKIPVPSISEQRAIAVFLDRETAKIDALIAKKERLIELLHEKRAALVSHAVTEGLDPSVPMKDSGVEWLDKIPAHWEAEELNRHWQIIDCKHRTAFYVDEGIPIVSTTEVKPGRLNLKQTRKTTYNEYVNLIEGDRLPKRGDIIYTRNASLGSAAYVDTDEIFCMGQDVCLITSSDQNQLFLN
jgi:type I restriction enzyme S subunit